MKKRAINQSGFSTGNKLLILVCVVVALAAVLSGLTKGGQNSQSTGKTTVTSSSNPQQSASANISYFVIKEWGVRAPNYGTLELTYSLHPDDNNLLNYAAVNSSQLLAADPLCQDRGGAIQRYAANDAVMPDNLPAKLYFSSGKTTSYSYANGYYYMYVAPVSECSTSDAANKVQQLNETTVQELSSKFEEIPSN